MCRSLSVNVDTGPKVVSCVHLLSSLVECNRPVSHTGLVHLIITPAVIIWFQTVKATPDVMFKSLKATYMRSQRVKKWDQVAKTSTVGRDGAAQLMQTQFKPHRDH